MLRDVRGDPCSAGSGTTLSDAWLSRQHLKGLVTGQPFVELLQRLDFNLANSLSGQANLLSNFSKRQRFGSVEAESHPQNRRLTLVNAI